jgi:hypothetical protein
MLMTPALLECIVTIKARASDPEPRTAGLRRLVFWMYT